MVCKELAADIMNILRQRPAYNGSLLNVMERDCHEDCRIVGDSVRIRDKGSGVHMFSVGTWQEVEVLLEETEDRLDTFLINDSAYTQEVRKRYPQATIKEYQSLILLADGHTPYTESRPEVEITTLDLSWLDFILEWYHDEEFGHKAYITHRILQGPGLGLLYKGQKAAFVLQHKNGESGPLVVHAIVRGMGLGTYLLRHFNKILLKKNSTLVSIIEPDNQPSQKMVINGGYQPTEKNVIWVYRKLRNTLYLP